MWHTNVPADPDQYRVAKTDPNGLEITNLRMQFEVQRDHNRHPNTCDVKIFNLNQSNRAEMEQLPLAVNLEAGHDGVSRLLFTGDVRFAMTELRGRDWLTLLQLGDASRIHSAARISRSYGPLTSVKTVLRDACASIGQELPKNIQVSQDLEDQFQTGTVVHGQLKDELTRLLAPYGYNWSFQNGRIQMLRDEETGNFEFPINEDTGMIGTPEFGSPPKSGKKPHMTVRMLLYPELTPGCRVRVQSKVVNGLFRVNKVKHTGDTHEQDWFTEVEIKQTQG